MLLPNIFTQFLSDIAFFDGEPLWRSRQARKKHMKFDRDLNRL